MRSRAPSASNLRLNDVGGAEHLVQGGEEGDGAVISRPAHEVDVGLVEAEDRYDLQDVLDVDAVRAPRALRVAGGARRVDHRRAQPAPNRGIEGGVRSRGHQVAVRQPAFRLLAPGGDVSPPTFHVGPRRLDDLDVVVIGAHDLRARIVQHVSDLRPPQAVVDRDGDQADTAKAAGDLKAHGRVEGHDRDAVARFAAKIAEQVGGPVGAPVQSREVDDVVAKDQCGFVRIALCVDLEKIDVGYENNRRRLLTWRYFGGGRGSRSHGRRAARRVRAPPESRGGGG